MAFAASVKQGNNTRYRNGGLRYPSRIAFEKFSPLGFLGQTPVRPSWWPIITDSRKEPPSSYWAFPHPTEAEFNATLSWYKGMLRTAWRFVDTGMDVYWKRPSTGEISYREPIGQPVLGLPMGAYREDERGVFLGNAHWSWEELLLSWLYGLEARPAETNPRNVWSRMEAYHIVVLSGGVPGGMRKVGTDQFGWAAREGTSWKKIVGLGIPALVGAVVTGGFIATALAPAAAATGTVVATTTATAVTPTVAAVAPVVTTAKILPIAGSILKGATAVGSVALKLTQQKEAVKAQEQAIQQQKEEELVKAYEAYALDAQKARTMPVPLSTFKEYVETGQMARLLDLSPTPEKYPPGYASPSDVAQIPVTQAGILEGIPKEYLVWGGLGLMGIILLLKGR